MKCRTCGKFMRKAVDMKIWVCRCGGWIAELDNVETLMTAVNAFLIPQETEPVRALEIENDVDAAG